MEGPAERWAVLDAAEWRYGQMKWKRVTNRSFATICGMALLVYAGVALSFGMAKLESSRQSLNWSLFEDPDGLLVAMDVLGDPFWPVGTDVTILLDRSGVGYDLASVEGSVATFKSPDGQLAVKKFDYLDISLNGSLVEVPPYPPMPIGHSFSSVRFVVWSLESQATSASVAAVAFAFLVVIVRKCWQQRRSAGRCLKCGYPIARRSPGRCPECGCAD